MRKNRRNKPSNGKCRTDALDFTGRRFGMLTVLHRINELTDQAYWMCRCDCGKEHAVRQTGFHNGTTGSCGCARTEAVRKALSLPVGEGSIRRAITALKQSAKRRRIIVELSDTEIRALFSLPCHYCGVSGSNSLKTYHIGPRAAELREQSVVRMNGIDRLDSDLGYAAGNVVSCCKHCNISKRERHVKDFAKWVRLVYTKWASSNYIDTEESA